MHDHVYVAFSQDNEFSADQVLAVAVCSCPLDVNSSCLAAVRLPTKRADVVSIVVVNCSSNWQSSRSPGP